VDRYVGACAAVLPGSLTVAAISCDDAFGDGGEGGEMWGGCDVDGAADTAITA